MQNTITDSLLLQHAGFPYPYPPSLPGSHPPSLPHCPSWTDDPLPPALTCTFHMLLILIILHNAPSSTLHSTTDNCTPTAPPFQPPRLHSCCSPPIYLARTHKPQSIKFYFSTVHSWHLEHSLPDPTAEAPNLRQLMRGIKRYHESPPDCRLPITPVLLRTFHTFLDTSYHDHLTLWTAMLVAFFGFLRNSELL